MRKTLFLVGLALLAVIAPVKAVRIELVEPSSAISISMTVAASAGQDYHTETFNQIGLLFNDTIQASAADSYATALTQFQIKNAISGAEPEPNEQYIDDALVLQCDFWQHSQSSPDSPEVPAFFTGMIDVNGIVFWKFLPSCETEYIGMPVVVSSFGARGIGASASALTTFEMGIYNYLIEPNMSSPYVVKGWCCPGGSYNNWPESGFRKNKFYSVLGDSIKLSFNIKADIETQNPYWHTDFTGCCAGYCATDCCNVTLSQWLSVTPIKTLLADKQYLASEGLLPVLQDRGEIDDETAQKALVEGACADGKSELIIIIPDLITDFCESPNDIRLTILSPDGKDNGYLITEGQDDSNDGYDDTPRIADETFTQTYCAPLIAFSRDDANAPPEVQVKIELDLDGNGTYDCNFTEHIQLVPFFEINQCFQEPNGVTQTYDLIETKPFIVRAKVKQPDDASTKFKLSMFNAATGEDISISKEGMSSSSRITDFVFNDTDTKNIEAGDYIFSILSEDSDGTKTFAWTPICQFKSSRTVRMLTIQTFFVNGQPGIWNDSYLNFAERVFPLPKRATDNAAHLEVVYLPVLLSSGPLQLQLKDMQLALWLYNIQHRLAPADFICTVLPEGILPDNAVGMRTGSAIVVEPRDDSKYIVGHEMGHIFGLGEEYIYSEPSISAPWILNQTFDFNSLGNPPPIKLAAGSFKVATRRPHAGESCDWADDSSAYSKPVEINTDAGKRWWCEGRYTGKGGYNLNSETEVNPNTLTMMSAATGSQWISGPEYRSLMKRMVSTAAKATFAAASLSSSQTRVAVSGIIDIPSKTAQLSPLIFDPNLDLTPEASDSNSLLIFMSEEGNILGDFKFTTLEGESADSTLNGPFVLAVDLPQDTARVIVTIDGVTAAELALSDNSPAIELLSPSGGEEITGQMLIHWSASDSDGDQLFYTVEFSHDNGTEWSVLAIDLTENELVVDVNQLPGGQNCLVKIVASDGWNHTEVISHSPFSIVTKPPQVSILDPVDSSVLTYSSNIQGRCIAFDPQAGDITDPNAIVWSSSIDGLLGKGNLVGFTLSFGTHVLSATVTNPEGKIATAISHVTVMANPSDLYQDNNVNLLDFAALANNWSKVCSEPNWCQGTDINRSGQVDFDDLIMFTDNWLWEKTP